jgi:CRISPR-associated endoribonuclease Cas6
LLNVEKGGGLKLHLQFSLKNEYLSNDFRMVIISFLKKALSDKYSEEYEKLYSLNNIKDFTFSVYFPNSSIEKHHIYVPDKKMSVTFSGYRDELIIKFYNAMLKYKNHDYPMKNNQTMTLKRIRLSPTRKAKGSQCIIKFLSPLLVRKHTKEKDIYLTYEDEGFLEQLNINTKKLLESINVKEKYTIKSFKPLKAAVTVVKHDDLLYQANIGTYFIEADNELINILYKAGLGSKRGLGFGMFEVLGGYDG